MNAGMKLQVIDKNGFTVGHVNAKLGMITREGVITRFNDKTVWTAIKGNEKKHRLYDGQLPVVYRSYVPSNSLI